MRGLRGMGGAGIGLVVAAVLTATTAVGGATAAPGRSAPPDPEVVAHARPAAAAKAAPSSIDSDVYAYASSATSRIYFVVAGRLKLTLETGSTTRYTGTLLDYSGNKAYPAKVNATDPNAPVVTFTSRNGTFKFTADSSFGTSFWSGTGTTVPAALGVPAAGVYFGASPHTVSSATYTYSLTQRVGPVTSKFEYTGSLTIRYDANGRISGGTFTVEKKDGTLLTTPLTSSGYYSSSYFYTDATIGTRTFGLTANLNGTTFTGYGFTGSGASASQWQLNGTKV